MNTLNKVMLIGNVGADPEIRHSQEGIQFASFSIATNEYRLDKKTGERQPVAQWHKVTAIGKLADLCKKYVRKGSKLYVEGSLNYSSYEKNGQKVYTTEIVLRQINFLSSRSEEEALRGGEDLQESYPVETYDENIPF